MMMAKMKTAIETVTDRLTEKMKWMIETVGVVCAATAIAKVAKAVDKLSSSDELGY